MFIVNILRLKSRIAQKFTSVSTPRIMSKIGYLLLFFRTTMPGLTQGVSSLDFLGNILPYILPTFVVLKYPISGTRTLRMHSPFRVGMSEMIFF